MRAVRDPGGDLGSGTRPCKRPFTSRRSGIDDDASRLVLRMLVRLDLHLAVGPVDEVRERVE
jgi:hypothetical protein